jgi:hypothetical protein
MGKKGKGRQSGGFASKSLRANHHHEVSRLGEETLKWTRRETANFVAWSNAHQKQQRRLMGERPRFALALRRNVNNILHERQALQSHRFRERRRRNGFLPAVSGPGVGELGFAMEHETSVSNGVSHPSGWLLRYSEDGRDDGADCGVGGCGDSKGMTVPSLQSLALTVFAHYIRDYRSAMGDEELYGALSILPPESITELSVLLSSGPTSSAKSTDVETTTQRGRERNRRRNNNRNMDIDPPPILYMDDDLAVLLGQHQHVEHLCFRSSRSTTSGRGTLTNVGLEALIPRAPVLSQGRHRRRRKDDTHDCDAKDNDIDVDESNVSADTDDVPECWDDDGDESSDNETFDEIFAYEEDEDGSTQESSRTFGGGSGCNLRLRRLELLDLSCADNTIDVDDYGNATTTSILLRWFETCSGITHLSLAGSFRNHHEVGRTLLLSLPRVLPDLEVLDVTRCPWATDSLLARTMDGYFRNRMRGGTQTGSDIHCDVSENESSTATSPQEHLPTIYHYRGRFEWMPETMHNVPETDFWDDASIEESWS